MHVIIIYPPSSFFMTYMYFLLRMIPCNIHRWEFELNGENEGGRVLCHVMSDNRGLGVGCLGLDSCVCN